MRILFAKVTGHGLHQHYRAAFQRLLKTVELQYLPKLRDCGDEDATVVLHKLQAYMSQSQYLNPPQGSMIPLNDESSRTRA